MSSKSFVATLNHEFHYGIHALRGIAACFVVLYHFKHFSMLNSLDYNSILNFMPRNKILEFSFHYGTYGVEVFWTISGYILTRKYYGSGNTLKDFLVRRLARIYPMHFFTLIIVLVIQFITLRTLGHYNVYNSNSSSQFLLQIFLASNWFRENTYSFNAPIWSVSIEILVYLFFLFFIRKQTAISYSLLTLFFVTSLRFFYPDLWFISALNFFFLGSSLSWIFGSKVVWNYQTTFIIFFCTFLDLLNKVRFHLLFALVIMLVFLFLESVIVATRITLKGSRFLGDISYSIYLTHVPIQLLFLLLIQKFQLRQNELASSEFFLLLYFSTCLLVSFCTYKYIEKPCRKIFLLKLL